MRLLCPFCEKEITSDEIQCSSCGTTYHFETLLRLKKLEKKAKEQNADEGRRADRIPRKFAVIYTTSQGFRQRYLSDISTGGVCIKTNSPLNPGERISLKIILPDDEEKLEILGQVAWSRKEKQVTSKGESPAGMGIKFLDLSPADEERIRKVLSKPQT
jgi:uncharacterized protein (TIGR02266 family)